MNIFIPLGGKGERFSKNGYLDPKPMIPVMEKRIIEYALDSIFHQLENEDQVYIFYSHRLEEHGFVEFIHSKYSWIQTIQVPDTKGAVETLYHGITQIYDKGIETNKKCLLLDGDTFYTQDVVTIFRSINENAVFYTKNTSENAIYSYIAMNDKGAIEDIREKVKISDNANTGAYAFMEMGELYTYCKHVLENQICFNNEPYTSCVISEMLKMGHIFKGQELEAECVFSLGTPEDVQGFVKTRHAFLFDLDGTLVVTEDIYFEVWRKILLKWNIHLTPDIFRRYIQGNNDKYVKDTLLNNIPITLEKISEQKDILFIEKIGKIKVIEGVYSFLADIREKAHKMCVVTNCNRKVAEYILSHTGLGKWMDFVITSEDCVRGKPDPEPYLRAIEKYGIDKKRCIVFEDSKSGLLSGKSVGAKCLIGVETIYSMAEMKLYGADKSIHDFVDLDLEGVMEIESGIMDSLKKDIEKNILLPLVTGVVIDSTKLKGGFIADVIGFKAKTQGCETVSMILKYENQEPNPLSEMAKKLELYEREYYFYEHVSKYVPIQTPRYYGLMKNRELENKGIMLENMLEKGYGLNLDLNREEIEVSLKIVARMAQLHTQFWGQSLKKRFPGLYKTNDALFCPFFKEFIEQRKETFMEKWGSLMNPGQREKWVQAIEDFGEIQQRLAEGNELTLIHGDVKSPNLFYDRANGNEPYFIDWQHCGIGKGAQDVVFFLIESFDIEDMKYNYPLLKNYYYKKVIENGVKYSYSQYEQDIRDAIRYIPVFTAIWFGTTPQDELIDKNWPYFFICKCLALLESL